MILKVHPHKIEIDTKEPVNEKEINVSKCQFIFDDTMPADMVKEAYFTYGNDTYKQIIVNDECDFPHEVLNKKGTVEIGVVPFKLDNEEYEVLYNPSPVYFETWVGSLKDNPMNSEEVTPSDKEQMEQLLQEGLDDIAEAIQKAENLDIDAEKVDTTTTVTITKQDGSTKTVLILDGKEGKKGDKGDTGSIKFIIVTVLPTEDIDESAIYLVPNLDAETDNAYIEYIYVDGKWEKLGETQIEVDLSDYVKNTDYATDSVGGVIKTSSSFATQISNGSLVCRVRTYEQYDSASSNAFIGKGTLENVLNARIGDIDTILTTLTTGNGV